MPQAPLDPGMLEYLRALRALLSKARNPGPPVRFAHASIDSVIVAHITDCQVDLDYETRFLRARLAEVERAT